MEGGERDVERMRRKLEKGRQMEGVEREEDWKRRKGG
jgi:hypothetical protein